MDHNATEMQKVADEYGDEWAENVAQFCGRHNLLIPNEGDLDVDITVSGALEFIIGGGSIAPEYNWYFALPQEMVDDYHELFDFDLRRKVVMMYDSSCGAFGLMFPLTWETFCSIASFNKHDGGKRC